MTYKKLLNRERNATTPSPFGNQRRCKIDGKIFDTLKSASEYHGIHYIVIKRRCESEDEEFSNWVLLSKNRKLTPDELKERKRLTCALRNKQYKDDKYFADYYKVKKAVDKQFVLKNRYSQLVRSGLKSGNTSKAFKELTGVTVEEFKKHLTDQVPDFFSRWNMTDLNLDHRIPVCSFDLTQESEVQFCYSMRNYQVLTAIDNRLKGAR